MAGPAGGALPPPHGWRLVRRGGFETRPYSPPPPFVGTTLCVVPKFAAAHTKRARHCLAPTDRRPFGPCCRDAMCWPWASLPPAAQVRPLTRNRLQPRLRV